MNRLVQLLRSVAAISVFASFPVMAQISVSDAWVRATVPAQTTTGAYMRINSTQDARLVAVKSTVAGMVEIHEMSMTSNKFGDVMKMRALPHGLALPAGKSVTLAPGGYHLMLMSLKQALTEGENVTLTLVIEGKDQARSTVDIVVPVQATASKASADAEHKH